MITTEISSHVRYLLEEKGVWLLSSSLLWSEELYKKIHVMVCLFVVFFFYLRSKRKRTFKQVVRTRLMGENTITN